MNGYHNEHFCTSRRVTLFVNERNGGKQNWIFSKKMEIRFDPKLESMDLDLCLVLLNFLIYHKFLKFIISGKEPYNLCYPSIY